MKADLSVHDWAAVGVAVGVSAVSVLGGGVTAIAILTRRRPPTIEIGSSGFKISRE